MAGDDERGTVFPTALPQGSRRHETLQSTRISANQAVATLREHALLAAIVVATALFRVVGLQRPAWTDERITLRFVREYGFVELVPVITVNQPHFPPYYLLLDALATLGAPPLLAGRLVSVVTGLATGVLVYGLGLRYYSRREALVAAAVVLVSPVVVAQSTWARMYAPLLFVATLSWWSLGPALEGRHEIRYAAATLVTVYLHPFGLLSLAAQTAYALSRRAAVVSLRRRVAGATGLGLAAAPAAAAVIGKVVLGGSYGDPRQVHHIVTPPTLAEVVLLPAALVTGTLHHRPLLLGAPPLLALVVYGWWRSPRGVPGGHSPTALLSWWLVAPVLLVVGLSYGVKPIWELKYLTWVLPPTALFVARALHQLPTRVGGLGTGLVHAGQLVGLTHYGFGYFVAMDVIPQ